MLVLLVAAPANGGGAAPGASEATAGEGETVEELVARAARAFDADQFDEAIAVLERAYALEPRPSVLFNMAQIQAARRDCAAAVALYDRFLAKASPTNRDRKRAEDRRAEMQACAEEARETEPAPSLPAAPPPAFDSHKAADLKARDPAAQISAIKIGALEQRPPRARLRTAGWVLAGVAVLATVASGYLAWRAYDDGNLGGLTYGTDPYRKQVSAGENSARASWWVGGGALLTAAGAGTLFWFSRRPAETASHPGD